MTRPVDPTAQPARKDRWLFAVMIVVAVFLVYQPAWRAGFIWDDDAHVTQPKMSGLDGLGRIWGDLSATQQYYPLLHSFFWLEYRFFGHDATGYHLINIGLHALNALMLGLVFSQLKVRWARLAAALFALHPVMVESVAWVTEQKNTLSGFFYLAAALAYLRFDGNRRRGWYFAAFALFVLALASKTVTATLPAALLVIFWWQRGRLSLRLDWRPLVPFFVVGACSGLFTAWIERNVVGAKGAAYDFTAIERVLIAGRAVCFYFGKLLWPETLVFIYPRWSVSQDTWWQYLYVAAAAAGLVFLWSIRRQRRGPLAAALFFVGTLFPVLGFFNIFPFIFSFVADHFQYLASLGVIVAAAAVLDWIGLKETVRRHALLRSGLPLGCCAVLGFLTWKQAHLYRDAETLYRKTLEENPTCSLAHGNLGALLMNTARLPEAIEHFEKALAVEPNEILTHHNLATVLFQVGRKAEAIAHYRAALKIHPSFSAAQNNLGFALFSEGETAEAIRLYESALALKPDYAEAHYNLGVALVKAGRPQEAIGHYATALRLSPNDPDTHNNLGTLLLQAGKPDEAAGQFSAALALKPEFSDAHNNLGIALFNQGRRAEAIRHFEAALRIDPESASARENLARVKSMPAGPDNQ
jgi:Flp pilus assembly protein TadD